VVAVRARVAPSPPVPMRAQRSVPIPGGVGGGPRHEIDPPLQPGRLEIATEPAGAQVFVDGVERGLSPLAVDLPAGVHRVVFLAEGRRLARETVDVSDAGRRLRAQLAPAVLPPELAGDAGLVVTCQSRDLRLFVDGIDTGASCPNQERLALVPGRHQLGLYLPVEDETVAVQKEVTLKSERTRRIYLRY
jgi:hypothetical protein